MLLYNNFGFKPKEVSFLIDLLISCFNNDDK